MEPITSPLHSAESALPNPFGPLVGQPLDDRQVDIADINAPAFDACRRLVEDVAGGGFAASLTVFGDTGTGKTHLIGRVRRWLETQPARLFVFVRMETSAAGIWRHLRRCLAMALLRADAAGVRYLDRLLTQRRAGLETIPHRDLSLALENLLDGLHVRDSAAWLRGEGLPDEVLASLHFSNPGPDEEPETSARHIVLSLCELLRPGVVVWCMDQIEAVLSSPTDREGPHAFGQMVSCLVDETRNSAVVCCEQISLMLTMEQVLDKAARDRVLGRREAIRPLSWAQAQRLIAARLDAAGVTWQVPEAKIRPLFKDDAASARAVIARCKDLFDEWRTGRTTPAEPFDTVLQRLYEERFARKEAAETDAILRNALPLLSRAAGLDCAAAPSPLDFALPDAGVAVCGEADGRSLATRVRRLSDAWKPDSKRRLILLRDARLPIPRGAVATAQRLTAIEQRGGRLVPISQEAAEALAALRRLLSDAESGDLSYRGDSLQAGAVERWIAGHLPSALDPLLAELSGAMPASSALAGRLAALLAERKIVRLEEAARSLEVTPEQVEECAGRDPRQFGVLRGGAAVLFQPVTAQES